MLEPQIARNFEVGLRGAIGDAQRYEVALFTIDVEDELIGREILTSPGRNFFENAGETSRDGLEFSWTAKPTDRIDTTVSYTYSDFAFTTSRRTRSSQPDAAAGDIATISTAAASSFPAPPRT